MMKVGDILRRALYLVGNQAIVPMGLGLVLIVLLTVVDVTLRRLFNSPLDFSLELIKLGLVVVVWSAVLYSTSRERHISVDVLTSRFPARVRRFLAAGFDLVSALLLLLIGWQAIIYAMGVARMRQETQMLGIPFYPFICIMAFSTIWAGLMLLVNFIDSVRGKGER
jgi:TRAP-type C4-dicarboxylate transport system permease small subunit